MKQTDIEDKSATLAYLDKILVSHVTPCLAPRNHS